MFGDTGHVIDYRKKSAELWGYLPERIARGDINSCKNLGLLFHNQGLYENAIICLDASVNMGLKDIYAILGNCYMNLNQDEKAYEYLVKGLNQEEKEANYYMGLYYDKNQNEIQACEYFKKAVSTEDEEIDARAINILANKYGIYYDEDKNKFLTGSEGKAYRGFNKKSVIFLTYFTFAILFISLTSVTDIWILENLYYLFKVVVGGFFCCLGMGRLLSNVEKLSNHTGIYIIGLIVLLIGASALSVGKMATIVIPIQLIIWIVLMRNTCLTLNHSMEMACVFLFMEMNWLGIIGILSKIVIVAIVYFRIKEEKGEDFKEGSSNIDKAPDEKEYEYTYYDSELRMEIKTGRYDTYSYQKDLEQFYKEFDKDTAKIRADNLHKLKQRISEGDEQAKEILKYIYNLVYEDGEYRVWEEEWRFKYILNLR